MLTLLCFRFGLHHKDLVTIECASVYSWLISLSTLLGDIVLCSVPHSEGI